MDRNFYQQILAKEHQREISQELETRAMLKEANSSVPSLKRRVRTIWRVLPVALTAAVLILLNFLR